jgi:hypothetical protein
MMLGGNHAFTIVFRTNDKGHELADLLNLYNQKVAKDILEMRETTAALGEKLAMVDMSKPGAAKNEIDEAAQLVCRLQDKLHQYKV